MSCCGGGDIDTDSETEADLTESIEEQTKQDRGRRAFLRLLRRVVALVVLALFLYQQPFMTKRKSKVVPLHLALNRAFQWAGSSPIVLESPQFQLTMNVTSRALLTPLEYVKVKTSKRSIGTAYGKTEQVLGRLVDGNATTLYKMAAQPMPNIPVIGAYLVTLGSALAPFCPGAEYLLISGCGCFLYGCARSSASASCSSPPTARSSTCALPSFGSATFSLAAACGASSAEACGGTPRSAAYAAASTRPGCSPPPSSRRSASR